MTDPLTYAPSDRTGVRNWDEAFVIGSVCNAAFYDPNPTLALWLSAFLEKQIVMREQDSDLDAQLDGDGMCSGFKSALVCIVGDPETASWVMQYYVRLGQAAVDTFRAGCHIPTRLLSDNLIKHAIFRVTEITKMQLKDPHFGYCGESCLRKPNGSSARQA
jgi:hypothetical protein